MYDIAQYRRHDRQIIHATKDRQYVIKNGEDKIIYENHHKRNGQKRESLEEYLKKSNKTHLLKLYKNVRSKKDPNRTIHKGDIIVYEGKRFIVRGCRFHWVNNHDDVIKRGKLRKAKKFKEAKLIKIRRFIEYPTSLIFREGVKNDKGIKVQDCTIVKHNTGLVFI